jgi:hypothetical protein
MEERIAGKSPFMPEIIAREEARERTQETTTWKNGSLVRKLTKRKSDRDQS